METIDPATGRPLPADAIQRILFIANSVHVYNIPPLASMKGYSAASWTEDPKRHISTCRVRIIETSVPRSSGDEHMKADIVLEDPSSGQLFAAAPYASPAVVEPALDSSRFFALRVQDEAGRKATLGVGFEERSEAFDFGVALQEAQKSLGMDAAGAGGSRVPAGKAAEAEEKKRDYSLKEGETITVNLAGSKMARKSRPQAQQQGSETQGASLSSFALPPPPSANTQRGSGILPPPPSAQDAKSKQLPDDTRRVTQKSAQELGFDDGQFGEFA